MEKLHLKTYADGTVANVCWTPKGPTFCPSDVTPHVHSFYEIVFVEAGRGSHIINGERVAIRPGHLALLAPGSFHDPRGLVGGARFWVFVFNPEALDGGSWSGAIYVAESRNLGAGQSLVRQTYESDRHYLLLQVPPKMRREIRRILRAIQLENTVHRIGAIDLIKAHLSVLLIGLLRLQGASHPDRPVAHIHPTVSEAMSYIDRSFREGITLSDIARHVGRSPAHVTSLIRQHTGRSAIAWLSDRRLHEARSMILTTNLSVEQIADTLGYKNPRHFSQMFRRHFGETPIRWRSRLVSGDSAGHDGHGLARH